MYRVLCRFFDHTNIQPHGTLPQERAKERLFETEESMPWEKGGPGIVWHTDAHTWDQAEGDMDEKWADEFDVDTTCYANPNDGTCHV